MFATLGGCIVLYASSKEKNGLIKRL